ncbi:hypothetical protein [uncultured Oscillibacter sp.]|uniref:hypothetical protein n=1 Tax=uncultured Oscillibacter sp. TaxID=876091 RepID=UPI0025D3F563|nr:hypothetical protein [uncultured Oscillibacter sp.]
MKELLKIEIDDHRPVTLTMAGSPISAAADILMAMGALHQSLLAHDPGAAHAFRSALTHGIADPDSPVFTTRFPGINSVFMTMKGEHEQ